MESQNVAPKTTTYNRQSTDSRKTTTFMPRTATHTSAEEHDKGRAKWLLTEIKNTNAIPVDDFKSLSLRSRRMILSSLTRNYYDGEDDDTFMNTIAQYTDDELIKIWNYDKKFKLLPSVEITPLVAARGSCPQYLTNMTKQNKHQILLHFAKLYHPLHTVHVSNKLKVIDHEPTFDMMLTSTESYQDILDIKTILPIPLLSAPKKVLKFETSVTSPPQEQTPIQSARTWAADLCKADISLTEVLSMRTE